MGRGAPQGLRQQLLSAPVYTDGYQLDRYGLPRLRAVLTERFAGEYGRDFVTAGLDVGVAWTGTRSVMSAFGTWLSIGPWRSRPRVVTYCTPSWDYQGVFRPLGFTPNPVSLGSLPECAPDISRLRDSLAALPADAGNLLVLNAQHNPTARNWSGEELQALIGSLDHHSAVLVDDAYFGLTDWGVEPSNALSLVLRSTGSPRASVVGRTLHPVFSFDRSVSSSPATAGR